MKTLLLLRHAKSSWNNYSLSDHDRPLNRRGKSDAPRIGQLLSDENLVPDLILCSTARRAKDTALAVADASGFDGEIVYSRDLYHAGVDSFIWLLSDVYDRYDRVMLVAHNPGLEELLDYLTGVSEWLPTAALVQISMPIHAWSEIADDAEGKFVALWRPKEL